MQLTNVSALPLSGNAWIRRSFACDSSVAPVAPLLLPGRFGWRNHRRLPAAERVEVLEVPVRVLSRRTVLFSSSARKSLIPDGGPS